MPNPPRKFRKVLAIALTILTKGYFRQYCQYPNRPNLKIWGLPAAILPALFHQLFRKITAHAVLRPPMSDEEEALLGAWLTQIGETDPEGIAAVMNKCRLNLDVRRYFVKRARGELCLVNSSMDAYLNEVRSKRKLKEE